MCLELDGLLQSEFHLNLVELAFLLHALSPNCTLSASPWQSPVQDQGIQQNQQAQDPGASSLRVWSPAAANVQAAAVCRAGAQTDTTGVKARAALDVCLELSVDPSKVRHCQGTAASVRRLCIAKGL